MIQQSNFWIYILKIKNRIVKRYMYLEDVMLSEVS